MFDELERFVQINKEINDRENWSFDEIGQMRLDLEKMREDHFCLSRSHTELIEKAKEMIG